MRKKLRLGASAALLAYLAWQTDWRHVAEAFVRLRWHWWLAGVALYGVTQVVSSLRWQRLARPLGFQESLRSFTAFYFVGMFFNLFLPTSVGGDAVRAWYLDNGSGRKAKALVSVLVDRASGLFVLLLLAGGAATLGPASLPEWIRWCVWGLSGGALLSLVTLPLALRLADRFARLRPLTAALRQYGRQPWLLLETTLLSGAIQAANVVLVWLLGEAMGLPVPALYYWVLVPVVTLLTLLPVSVNGMGVRESGMVFLLAPLGVATGTAMSLSFLWFAAFSATSLVGVVIYVWGRFPRVEVRADDQPLGDCADQGRTRQPEAAA